MGFLLGEEKSVAVVSVHLSTATVTMFGLGELPKEYNKAVHGPYDPAVFYGKPDTPLAQVKLGELPGWLGRRSKNPVDWGRACSRAYWRFLHKYAFPRNSGLTPIIQMSAMTIALFYCMNYDKFKHHRNFKYHW